jgi:hypothetical protein
MLGKENMYYAEEMVRLEEKVADMPTCIHITRDRSGKQGKPIFYDFCLFCDLVVRFNDRIMIDDNGHICDLSGERISDYSCDSEYGVLDFDGEYDTYVICPFIDAINIYPDAIIKASMDGLCNEDILLYLSANNLIVRDKEDMRQEVEDYLISTMSVAEVATRISMYCGCLFANVLDIVKQLRYCELSLRAAIEEIMWEINQK